MAQRSLKMWNEANLCSACKLSKGADGQPIRTMATHSITDSLETEPGVFKESAPRHGCAQHRVAPMVYPLAGGCVPFEQYLMEAV